MDRSPDPRTHPVPRVPYLARLFAALDAEPRLLVLKSRQVLASWTVAGWLLHRALYHGPAECMILSKEQRSAEELLRRIAKLIAHLPQWMAVRMEMSRKQLYLPKVRSRIFTLPTVPEAVRLYTPTIVVWDEMAFTRDAERLWEALSPALDSSARFVGIITPNGRFCLFGRLVEQASQTGFAVHRIHYRERADRGETWKREKMRELSDAEWRREYELSLEENNGLRVIESFSATVHLLQKALSKADIARAKRKFRAIDYGYRTPVVLWLAEVAPEEIVVFDEWIGDNATRDELLLTIQERDKKWNLKEKDFAWTACDPAGAQASDTGVPIVDFLNGSGIKLVYRKSRIEDGLDLLRMLFRSADGTVRMKLSPSCQRLIIDLESYAYDERTGKPIKGIHDHSVDALRYFALAYHAPSPATIRSRVAGSARR
ncbi:MAG: hypothetical protein OEM52_07925 [bacterium]|nr:hypothetical protein [bacterium]